MTIVVGYTPTPPGRAALVAAAGVAAERKQPVVVNSSAATHWPTRLRHAGRPRLGQDHVGRAGVEFGIRQSIRGREASEEVVTVLEEVGAELCVIGIRRRTAVGKMLMGATPTAS